MKRKPKYHSPDGINWRDPNMPVIRDYRMGNGERRVIVDPDYEHCYREMLMNTVLGGDYWRNDPTYYSKRRI